MRQRDAVEGGLGRSVGLVGAVLAAVASLAGCPGGNGAGAGGGGWQRPPASVTAIAVVTSDVPVYLDEIGRCWARELVSIQPQVTGAITSIQFTDGAEVKKDQVLFTIDPRPYKAQVDLAAGMLAQSRAALELARIELGRADELLKTKAGSRQDYDAKKGAVSVAEAKVQADEASLELANVNLDYCTIRSPIDGRTGQRLVDLGNVVTAHSGTSLLVVQRLDPIYADFTVTEAELAQVRQSMAQGRLRVEVRLAEGDETIREGELTFLDAAVQDGTGTVKLRATVPNADRFLWPGQFIRVRLVLGTRAHAILVPAKAQQISQKGPFVFCVAKGEKGEVADFRPVKVGQRQGDLVVIESGLTGNERVVVNGQLMLFPGAPVVAKDAQETKAQESKAP